MMPELTEKEFLARCRIAYKYGLGRRNIAVLMRDWLDALMRFEHTFFSNGQSQGQTWLRFVNDEFKRTNEGKNTLATDEDGYVLQQIAAVFSHPCQQCATNPDAWHTRSGFCNHREKSSKTRKKMDSK